MAQRLTVISLDKVIYEGRFSGILRFMEHFRAGKPVSLEWPHAHAGHTRLLVSACFGLSSKEVYERRREVVLWSQP